MRTMQNNISLKLASLWIALPIALAALAPITGCRGERSDKRPREFFPGMDNQPKYKAQSQSNFFADGRSMRQPVTGTVAFGRQAQLQFGASADERSASEHKITLDRMDLLRDNDLVYKGIDDFDDYVDEVPIRALEGIPDDQPISADLVRSLIDRGQDRFNVFCMVCHGELGDGKGMVGVQWSYPLPNFHDPIYQPGAPKGQDGYIFHVIRNGVANQPGVTPALRMPAYANQINERDAWSIVLYLRALQATLKGSIDEAPRSLQADLLASRPATPPKPEQPAGPIGATAKITDLLQFEPKTITIKVGETIQWTNDSLVTHTVTADPSKAAFAKNVLLPPGADVFDSGDLLPDETYLHLFTVPGTYRYFCKPHESTGMSGEIIVEE